MDKMKKQDAIELLEKQHELIEDLVLGLKDLAFKAQESYREYKRLLFNKQQEIIED